MLQVQIYNNLLTKLQSVTDLDIVGNYTYVQYDNSLKIVNLDDMTSMNYQETEAVPFAENFIVERTFIEKINRTEYETEYVLLFPLEKEEECIQALQDFRDLVFNNPTDTITDDGTTYNIEFKISRGQKKTISAVEDGTVYVTYGVNVFMTLVENGVLNSNISFKLAKDGEALQDIDLIDFSIATEVGIDPDAKFNIQNINNRPISRGTGGNLQLYYSGSDIDKELLNQIAGKANREQKYDIEVIIDGVTYTYSALIKKGDFKVTKGAVFYLSIDWVES